MYSSFEISNYLIFHMQGISSHPIIKGITTGGIHRAYTRKYRAKEIINATKVSSILCISAIALRSTEKTTIRMVQRVEQKHRAEMNTENTRAFVSNKIASPSARLKPFKPRSSFSRGKH